jgi:heterodisulfide reductase subunit A
MSEVLIVGAGFSGMTAALTLADRGIKVNLLDKRPAMGGFFPFLDNQFPTNSCGVCFLSPNPPAYCPFIECSLRENINFIPNSIVEKIEGEQGKFNVKIHIKNNYVNNELCIDCGKCEEVCPVEVDNELVDGIEKRKAVFKFYPKNVKKSYFLDETNCNKCGKCVEICPTNAINLENSNEKNINLHVSDIILTPGFKAVSGDIKEEFGFGINKNVLSSIQYERLISPSGPTLGIPKRPSDGNAPKRIAFLQCVGSRDIRKKGNPFCSSVCCMFAIKQAIFTKKQIPDAEVVIFYMDIRAFGKGYEEYFNEAKDKYGIKFIRCHVSTIKEHGKDDILTITYYENGELKEKDFDLAVLSLGFYQDEDTENLIKKSNIVTNDFNFAETDEFSPNNTNVNGIYVAGSFIAPKDIPESTLDGASAAAKVMENINVNKEIKPDLMSSAVNVEEPRIGVIICKCGNILEQSLDLDTIIQSAKNINEVVYTDILDALCSREVLNKLKKIISDNALNKVVIGGCSVRELEGIFKKFCKDVGYSILDFEFVNLREQCVFGGEGFPKDVLTEKAVVSLNASILKLKLNKKPQNFKSKIKNSALVVGGGIAGLTAALNLASQGYNVYIVEKNDKIGGRLLNAHFTIKGADVNDNLDKLIKKVENNENIEIFTSAEIISTTGEVGNRITTIKVNDQEKTIEHGAVIIATGGNEVKPVSYDYEKSEHIITQVELEDKIANKTLDDNIKSVVMIQCVESREKGKREYCSRVCCTHAIKNGLKLKEINPDLELIVLYRDIRAYGFYENYYRELRDKGVLFIPYNNKDDIVVKIDNDKIKIEFLDPIINEKISKNIDMLVLSTGVQPAVNENLSKIFGIPLDKNGFFDEANKKTGLTNFMEKDMFMAGLCHGPKHIEETIIHANAAAARASVFLSKNEIKALEKRSYVIERFCSCCGICVDVCPFNARVLDEENKVAKVIESACEACGACVMACPNGAAQQYGFEKQQILSFVDRLIS